MTILVRLWPQYCVRRKSHLSKRHRCSVNVAHTRNCHSGLVKKQQQIHREICCFIIVREKCDIFDICDKNCSCFELRSENNYWDAGKITDPRWCLDFARLSKGPWIGQKVIPKYFFSWIYSLMDKPLSFHEKKITNFSLLCKEVQGIRRTNYYQSAVLLHW